MRELFVGRDEDGRVQLEGLVGGLSGMGASGADRGVCLPVLVSFVIEGLADGVIKPLP